MDNKTSKVSKSQQAAVNRYVKKNYDRLYITFPKGQKETIKEYADKKGVSINEYIKQAVYTQIEKDKTNP